MGLIIGKENAFDSEELIYKCGNSIESISLVLSGSVRVESESGTETVGVAKFVGLDDIEGSTYSGDYYVTAGTKLMVFPVSDIYSLIDFFEANPSIHQRFYFPLCHIMEYLYSKYEKLFNIATDIYASLKTNHQKYITYCEANDISPALFNLPHGASLFKYDEQSFSQNYNIFLACYKAPDKMKIIYNKNPENFLKQQINITNSLCTTFEDMTFYVKGLISSYVSRSQDCLFALVSNLAPNVSKKAYDEICTLLCEMKDSLSSIALGTSFQIDLNRANFYITMAENATPKDDDIPLASSDDDFDYENSDSSDEYFSSDDLGSVLDLIDGDSQKTISENHELESLLLNLCEYAGVDEQFHDDFNNHINFYIQMSDKSSREDDARTFRREVTKLFYALYEKVFFQYAKDKNPPFFAKAFLDYGVIDDRLLTDEQLETLANIPPLMDISPCKVWRMSDWLMAIYRGEKMPSKNEFDKDYVEHVREKKRELHLTPAEETAMLEDNHAKVVFEIENVVKYNGRILSGNMLAFQPMLNRFDFEGDLKSFILDSSIINQTLNDLLNIDYSIFHREQMYTNPEKGIDKEVIQLQVFPDFVLFPVYGSRGIMWQDLSGKRSNTPGRFFLPSFLKSNIMDTMIALVGRFRWELCKSVTGTAWNNITVPSLTAEYSDYIQFYRKNRDLTAEKKEAVKTQLTRCRNNTREVFIADYTTWIKYEATGAVRLNKVSRQILSTYCPFTKEIRTKLKGQPLYDEAMKKFNTIQQKKINEMQTRIRALEKANAEITAEILDTQAFYDL